MRAISTYILAWCDVSFCLSVCLSACLSLTFAVRKQMEVLAVRGTVGTKTMHLGCTLALTG